MTDFNAKYAEYQESILSYLPKGGKVWTKQYREDVSHAMAGIAISRLVQWDIELDIEFDFNVHEDGHVYSRTNLVDIALDVS